MSRSTVQVVSHRSQKTSSSGPSIITPSYTASSYLQTSSIGKPQTKTIDHRSHQATTTTAYTTSISSLAKPTVTTTTSSVVNMRSNTSKPSVPNVVSTTKTTTSSVVVNQRGGSNQASKPTSQVVSKPSSQAASKVASQAPTKKIEERKVVDGSEIQEAFELFDSNDGKIDAREVKDAMVNIGYDEKNPVVYQVVTELDTPRNNNAGGASFEDFCQTVNNRLPDKETDDDLRRIFNLFVDDPDSDTTSLESIKRVADELGENIEEGELNAMLNKASKAGSRLTFEDFVSIMKDNF
jgi:Ca2+-binding EF-hand superfamily protein